MTKQKAIERLKALRHCRVEDDDGVPDREDTKVLRDSLNIAIECIEKQIPQEAIDYVCPVCGHDMGFDEKNYCSNCGQRIGDNE